MAKVQLITATDLAATLPVQQFVQRVTVDSGTPSPSFALRAMSAFKPTTPNILLFPEAGCKIASGKLASVYDLFGTVDATQATAGSQWYAGNTVAPNEKTSIKAVTGMSAVSLGFADIVKADTARWTMLQNLKCNNVGSARIYYGTAYLAITATEIILHNGTSAVLTGTYASVSGQNMTIECRYMAGAGVILVDGVAIPTVAASLGITFGEITFNATYPFDGNTNGFGVFTNEFTAYDSQAISHFLATEFPAIETIAVGSQKIATSNLEATVFGATTIPEVTDAGAWTALSTPAWAHYNNDVAIGSVFGKMYNGFAAQLINNYCPVGFHVGSELEQEMLSDYLGGDTGSGGKIKALYGTFLNEFSTNESGISLLAGGQRSPTGDFAVGGSYALLWLNSGDKRVIVSLTDTTFIISDIIDSGHGLSVRLFSNTPHLEKLTYDSGLFATDIASTPKSIRIPFGCKVTNIKCVTSTSVTAIEAKLFDYAGTELETLITGKVCNATTKSFNVVADQTVSYTDNYVRVTATGNSGVGMTIYVTIEPI